MLDSYSFFTRDSGGGLTLIAKHPSDCRTWHWAISISKYRYKEEPRYWFKLSMMPRDMCINQWHHCLHLFKLCVISIAFQDYHHNPKMWYNREHT